MKKLNIKIGMMLSLIALAYFCGSNVNAQTLNSADERLKSIASLPNEKVHLHLDKPYYAAGDVIWLKAYVVDYSSNKPSSNSGVLHADLINGKNQLTKQLTLPIKGGTTWGSIELPDTLSEGNYRLRAYTNLMRNAGPNYFYDQNIKIGNSLNNNIYTQTTFSKDNTTTVKAIIKITDKDKKPLAGSKFTYQIFLTDKKPLEGITNANANGEITLSFEEPKAAQSFNPYINLSTQLTNGFNVLKSIPIVLNNNNIDVQFLPEGGNLVSGLPCKIGIKAINSLGLGENITGTIVDNDGNEVTAFETLYLGMGNCFLTPDASKTYSAKVKHNGGVKTFPLPKVVASGYALAATALDSTKIDVKVLMSESLVNNGQLRLIGHRLGSVLFDIAIPTQRQISSVSIPRSKLPSGTIQLTLFDPQGKAAAERIVFNNNPQTYIALATEGLKNVYHTREKVDINLNATNDGLPTQGSLSVAITNLDAVNADENNESNLFSSLLVKSEAKGFIENVGAYFIGDAAINRERIDNLMLTQAWRNIDWAATANTQKYQPEKGISIQGTVTTIGKKPVNKAKVTLLFPNNKMVIANTETNEKGSFKFDEIYLEDDNKFIVQAATPEGKKNVNVRLDKVTSEEIDVRKYPQEKDVNVTLMSYLSSSDAYFEQQMKSGFLERTNVLKTVDIVGKKITKEDMAAPHSLNLNGRGRADQVITEADLGMTPSLANFIAQGRVRGVADSAGYAISTRSKLDETGNIYHPVLSVSLDGMILQNLKLEDIPVANIESIEVITTPSLLTIYGTQVNDGLLVVSSKRGKSLTMADIYTPGLVASTLKGYTPIKQFYSPKYDVKTETADLRTTTYWNPQIFTDAKGLASFSFYNSDRKGKQRIVIEGIDADGNLARKVLTYEVK
ncbi:TonB-dependent receptor [Nubsella zeaxanthinifaciens]|uniref:TonB-dependent receptor n=1 Tax=Nubsella zeaxanthinifaciens TaxID=392412 RepID=UPI000DE21C3C|nr:TonB-dependent receptor [Nubsella zeaxanthinifaciens]